MSGNKGFSNNKKMLAKSGSKIISNIVTYYILQELRNLEKSALIVYPVRRYDVLSDSLIFKKTIYMAY